MATKLELRTQDDGSVRISNDNTTIYIFEDGTVSISSLDPVKLTGACQVKLDNARITSDAERAFAEALAVKLTKKTSN